MSPQDVFINIGFSGEYPSSSLRSPNTFTLGQDSAGDYYSPNSLLTFPNMFSNLLIHITYITYMHLGGTLMTVTLPVMATAKIR